MSVDKFTTILDSLATFAPATAQLLRHRAGRLRVTLTTGDALNTYGVSLELTAILELLVHRCKYCGETEYSEPAFSCLGHRFETQWQPLAEATTPSLIECLAKMEVSAREMQARRAA